MVHVGGAKLIKEIADEIGVGVHFNPFVTWNDKVLLIRCSSMELFGCMTCYRMCSGGTDST